MRLSRQQQNTSVALRAARVGTVSLLCTLALSACVAAPEPAPTTAAPTAEPTVAPEPVLIPDGTAADNLPVFAAVVDQVWGTDARVEGRAYVDALVDVGFDKGQMELTADRTTVNDPVDSLQFSVLWQGECLVGQVGPSIQAPVAVVLDPVPTGRCLIGQTRPIDW